MKRPINEMKVVFPSLSENERFARIAVSGFLSFIDPKIDELADIKTAVSEAVTNAIVHAYPDTIGRIVMRLRILGGTTLEIMVKDFGKGIENVGEAMKPLYTTGGSERSGMGFTIMESFMDKLRVRSEPGKGTTVVMQRAIRIRLGKR